MITPARGPLAWDDAPVDAVSDWDALAHPQSEYARGGNPPLAT